MMFKRKICGVVLAVALVAGAIPGAVSSAAAVETGQKLDKPRWPYTVKHYATIAIGVAASIALLVLLAGDDNDRPTSP